MSAINNPKVVVIGGGTGMPVILRGLKNLPIDLTTLVTVADDGGSSGRLRNSIDMPAPGDVRNCLAALSDAEPFLLELFQHRFKAGEGLNGHSMGNLLLAAMASITGDFYTGIQEISRVLSVKGKIYPISNDSMFLSAEMMDGTIVTGESKIPLANKRIKRVFMTPAPAEPLPDALKAIEEADLIVISPGSLYTSILPNLIVNGVSEALHACKAKVIYICNVMTQAGETEGYTASDHVQAIIDHIGPGTINGIIVNNEAIDNQIRAVYEEENAKPVIYDLECLRGMGLEIIDRDIIMEESGTLRHDTHKIAELIQSLLNF